MNLTDYCSQDDGVSGFGNRLPEEFDYQPNSARDQGQHLDRSALVIPFGGAPFFSLEVLLW